MPTLLKSRDVKARKHHWCQPCGSYTIKAGQKYRRESYVFDGQAYDWLMCLRCTEIISLVRAWCGDRDEGVGPEDFYEWAMEHRENPTYGSVAYSYLERTDSVPKEDE